LKTEKLEMTGSNIKSSGAKAEEKGFLLSIFELYGIAG
jgi:hypothetical protein